MSLIPLFLSVKSIIILSLFHPIYCQYHRHNIPIIMCLIHMCFCMCIPSGNLAWPWNIATFHRQSSIHGTFSIANCYTTRGSTVGIAHRTRLNGMDIVMDLRVMPGVTQRMSVCVVNAAANLGLSFLFDMLLFSIVFDLVLRFVFSSVFDLINVVLDGFRMFSKYCLNVWWVVWKSNSIWRGAWMMDFPPRQSNSVARYLEREREIYIYIYGF